MADDDQAAKLAHHLARYREIDTAVLELRNALRSVPFDATAAPEAQRVAVGDALNHVVRFLQSFGFARETLPLMHLQGALDAVSAGKAQAVLTPPKIDHRAPDAPNSELPRIYAVAAVETHMRDGMKLRDACTTVANALRGRVPGISTGAALETFRETVRRDPHGPKAELLHQARATTLGWAPANIVEAIRVMTGQNNPE
jgi:hypothetical protein